MSSQIDLFAPDPYEPSVRRAETGELRKTVRTFLQSLLANPGRPSAYELMKALDAAHGLAARWALLEAVRELAEDPAMPFKDREYLATMLNTEALDQALRGLGAPEPAAVSSVDQLLQASALYRSTVAFRDMVAFMGRFRAYSPCNNALARLQNPSCRFYATVKTWGEKFGRAPKEDARLLLILAPMHPVLVVYDLDATDGRPVPKELEEFAKFTGALEPTRLDRLLENANRYRIRVDFKPLSSIHAGMAIHLPGAGPWKKRIVINRDLDLPSRFAVLCHELAHILLGHLGSDHDAWWYSRRGLDHATVETEAEAVAFIVTTRQGLRGPSDRYISRHAPAGEADATGKVPIPQTVSTDMIAKVAGLIERMASETMPKPKPRPPVQPKASQ